MTGDPDADIIDCGTRPNVRHAMVLSALRNGKHVYNGIPFAANVDHARELRDAWKASGKVAVVDAFSQWLPALDWQRNGCKKACSANRLAGRVVSISRCSIGRIRSFLITGLVRAGVSALRNLGSHTLHMIAFMFGEVEEVVAHDAQLLHEWKFPDGSVIRPQTNDFASLLLRMKNGMLMQLQVALRGIRQQRPIRGERAEFSDQS